MSNMLSNTSAPRGSTIRNPVRFILLILAIAAFPSAVWPMEIEWTRMTGQFPVDSAPLLVDLDGNGQQELVAVNRGGQVMTWALDGSATGTGQDGTAAQLPEGQWTSTPAERGDPSEGFSLIFGSTQGLLVALDREFHELWRYKLPGETTWARATPCIVERNGRPVCCIADHSGTVTCLDLDGTKAWSAALGGGACRAQAQSFALDDGTRAFLVSAGAALHCLDADGNVLWRRELCGDVLSRAEVLALPDRRLILCGAGAGSLYALSPSGEVVWQRAVGDEIDTSIVVLPRNNDSPLIVCAGLWGNLHAFDVEGRPVWTHLYRAKGRATPLVLDADLDGEAEVLAPTYDQHAYVFKSDGELADVVRLSGSLNASPVAVPQKDTGRTDAILASSVLLVHRLRPGPPISAYGSRADAADVTADARNPVADGDVPGVVIGNPRGALVRVNLFAENPDGCASILGAVTARSRFEIPLPKGWSDSPKPLAVRVRDAAGRMLLEKTISIPPTIQEPKGAPPLTAWPVPAYAWFPDADNAPATSHRQANAPQEVSVGPLYLDEVDQGALTLSSGLAHDIRVRVTVVLPARADGAKFAGVIVLREAASVGTVNGERVPDALPALGDAGLVTVPASGAARLWVRVDAHGAEPGVYKGRLAIQPILGEAEPVEAPLAISVVDLRLPNPLPLSLCTWDYVPNNWFPERTGEVLDDMARHGVNVFPRTAMPAAKADAQGRLTFDWSALDAELARLSGRGQILFQVGHPPVTFDTGVAEPAKRPIEIAYFRAFRDHLEERGRDNAGFASYPLDEPGLDLGKNVPILIDAAQLIHEADPKFRVYTDPVPTLSWADFERLEPLIDVWCPNMRLVSGTLAKDPRMERLLKSGKTIWSYECVSQVRSLSPLRYNRANAWRASFFGLEGIGFWTHCTTQTDPWLAGKTMNDEYALVYPGALPVPSVRWEAVRDGLEDIGAASLLEQEIARHRSAGTAPESVAEAEDALRIARTDIMELSDQAFVESRDFLRAGDRTMWHTPTDVEMFQRHRARIAELTLALKAK